MWISPTTSGRDLIQTKKNNTATTAANGGDEAAEMGREPPILEEWPAEYISATTGRASSKYLIFKKNNS